MNLPAPLTAEALSAADAEVDPDSLAAATRLRARFGTDIATAALHQSSLRRRARAKFGDRAAELVFTRSGLEQATRPDVAAHHAARLVAAGARRVVDLGCGMGADALAFAAAGLEVVAVEIDPATAAVATANLGGGGTVVCGDAEAFPLRADDAVFCDPARRTEGGRRWQVEDFRPRWSLVSELLAGGRVAGVKLGPALPHALIPDGVEAQWVTHRSEVVEVALWAGPGSTPGRRSALIWPHHELITEPTEPRPVRAVGRYLYEPDGSVIRAGGIAQLGARLDAGLLDPQIAYLTADELTETPFASAFAVEAVLPYDVRVVRRELRERGVGRLEIKKRGVDMDPAALRKKLALSGVESATLVISRTPRGAVAVLAQRVGGSTP